MRLLFAVVFLFATSNTFYRIYTIRRLANRPRRLCMSCRTINKPALLRDGGTACTECGHLDPVALDSRVATEHFALIGQTPPRT